MANKKSEVPAAERIRDNQRRSRMRQKEHIEELKQKIADFEKRGIEATIEVQKAARRVASENQLLRTLLAMNGISQADVDLFVANAGNSASNHNLPQQSHSLDGQRTPMLSIAIHQPLENRSPSVCSPSSCPPSVCSPSYSNMTCTPATHSPAVCCTVVAPQPANIPVTFQDYSVLPTPGMVTSPSDFETPCGEAAQLLVSVRGGELEEAMQALGCITERMCSIKNTDILELLDS